MKRLLRLWVTVLAFANLSTLGFSDTLVEKTNILVTAIHEANLEEIELGQVSMQKASNKAVKEYGHQMVIAHQQGDEKLSKVVTSESLTLLPMESSAKSAQESLAKKSDKDFDKAYISLMIDKHQKLQNKLKEAQTWLTDGPVKQLNDEMFTTVSHHLMMAKQLELDLKGMK